MALRLTLNGQSRTFDTLKEDASVAELVSELGLKSDRIALERNGEILSRGRWAETVLVDGDKLEVVHFVGGGRC
jgi:sulfur carrier protein